MKQIQAMRFERKEMLRLVFFTSGFCSLLYQIVWQRLFGLVCSSDSVTAALVVAAFLSGLGLGNLFSAKISNRLSPRFSFRMLAAIETLIAAMALVSPVVYYDFLFDYFQTNIINLPETFLILFASLLPPTFLMGMSMPLLGRGIVEKAENTASVLGDLYAANILGAGFGAFFTAFFLIGALGMEVALYFGSILNFAIAAVLWFIPHRFRAPRVTISESKNRLKPFLPVFAFGLLVLLNLSRHNPDGSFMESFIFQSVVPGFFIIACAVYAVGLERYTVKNPIDLAMLALAGACLYFLTRLDGFHFPPAAAALAFAIRYRSQPGSTAKATASRLLRLCLIMIASWLIVSTLDCRWWDQFHYLVGMNWVAYSHGDRRNFSWKDALPPALVLVLLALIFCTELGPRSAAAIAVVAVAFVACFATAPIDAGVSDGRPNGIARLSASLMMIVVLLCAHDVSYTVITMSLLAVVGLHLLWKHVIDGEPTERYKLSVPFWTFLAFAAGFVSVAMELIWFRTLYTYFLGNSYVFGPMLGIFLLCDGLGMWAAIKIVKSIRNYPLAFLAAQISVAVTTLLMYLVLLQLPHWTPTMLNMSLGSLVLMGAPCFFIGFTFPLVQAAIQNEDGRIGSRIGLILFSNTLGNAVGGIAAAFILLGILGTMPSIILLSFLPLAATAYCVIKKLPWRPIFAAGLSLALMCALLPDNGSFWIAIHHDIRRSGHGTTDEAAILVEDYSGVCLISVNPTPVQFFLDADVKSRGSLYSAGHRQGDIPFGSHQTRRGLLAPAFHPNPKTVLCMGVGSATTPFTMGMRDSITRIDMVEIARAEIPALIAVTERDFGRYLKPLFFGSRYRLIVGDGRKYLFGTEQRYDIIQADMKFPQTSGSGALYSREFYECTLEHLNPGGYFIQQSSIGENRMNTLRSVFPYVYILHNYAICARQPLDVSYEALSRYLEGELTKNLFQAGFNPEVIKRLMDDFADDGDFVLLPPFDADQPGLMINKDLMPIDEFYLNRPLVSTDFSPRKWFLRTARKDSTQ